MPAGLAIAVAIDGADQPPITSDVAGGHKPDFVDAEHRAWRISDARAARRSPGSTVEASASNRRVGQVRAADAGGPRAGAVSDPARRGDRRRARSEGSVPALPRPGRSRCTDPATRCRASRPVTKLAITHAAPTRVSRGSTRARSDRRPGCAAPAGGAPKPRTRVPKPRAQRARDVAERVPRVELAHADGARSRSPSR